VKTNPVCGHEIEFSPEIGQRSLPLDVTDNARHSEQLSRCAEKRFAACIEAENIMAEAFANVEKITRARAEIENAQRRRAIEPKVLRPLDIDFYPINDVFETIDLRRTRSIRIFVAQISKLHPIDIVQNAVFVDRMCQSAEMFPGAGEQVGRKEFPKLA